MHRSVSDKGGACVVSNRMDSKKRHYRAIRAIGDLCNETIDSKELAWLENRLCSDPVTQALYIDYMAMHASLHAEGASLRQAADEPLDEGSGFKGSGAQLSSRREHGGERLDVGSIPSSFSFLRANFFMLSASLVGIALFSSLLTYGIISFSNTSFSSTMIQVANNQAANNDTNNTSDREVVATITGTHNCLWGDTSGLAGMGSGLGYGSGLTVGQKLELRQGLAELTFENGATVLLEGPATFAVSATHEVNLHEGRLAVVVPQKSRSFRIHTRSLDVFDVGTEFGLYAKQSGATEVHVFNGLVKADVLDSSGRALRRLELGPSEAARVNPVSLAVYEFPSNEAAFVRSMLPTFGPSDKLLAYESFDYPAGPLSAQNGGFGWAGPWFDIAADPSEAPNSNGVEAGSLATKGLPPLGNRAVQTGQQNRIRRSLATSVGGIFDAAGLVENRDGVRLVGRDGHQIYISFLQRVSKVDDEFYGVELHRGDGNANRVLSIGNGAEGTGYGATSIYNLYGLDNFPSLGVEATEANLFVIKISFGMDNQDIVEIYRNPASLKDEKACQADAVLKGNFAFDRISMSSFHGTKIHEVDEIRVGTHFLAVTGRWGGDRGRLLPRITYRSKPSRLTFGLAFAPRFQGMVDLRQPKVSRKALASGFRTGHPTLARSAHLAFGTSVF